MKTEGVTRKSLWRILIGIVAIIVPFNIPAFARDIEYKDSEFPVYVTPGEPTQINFPGSISGGFKKKNSAISIDRKQSDLIIFARDTLDESGEALIVRLEDGRSYSVRVRRSTPDMVRDDVVKVEDLRGSAPSKEEEEAPYKEKSFEYAPPTQVSGFVREMVLTTEFGKSSIQGYRVSERHKGETILHDGALHATVEKIFVGTTLWGYVIDAENLLDQTQQINPATFRLDGTRAISAAQWELSPRPLDIEQQVSGKHKTKIYIVTRAK